jgi:transcription-repair coupling factor (superfamily II helicase)
MNPPQSFDKLIPKIAKGSGFQEVVKSLSTGESKLKLSGIPNSLSAFLIGHVQSKLDRDILVLTAEVEGAEKWRDDLQAIIGKDNVSYFPAWENNVYENTALTQEASALRIETATHLSQGVRRVIVAPAVALLVPLIPPHALELCTLKLQLEQHHDINEILSHLLETGFDQVNAVDNIGQFSQRGGILDIYPNSANHPFRIEFFDDEIDSIRQFDVVSQRSKGSCQEAIIPPARELVECQPFYEDYQQRIRSIGSKTKHLEELIEKLDLGESLEGLEQYMPFLYGSDDGLFEHLSKPIIFTEDLSDITEAVNSFVKVVGRTFDRQKPNGLQPEQLIHNADWLANKLENQTTISPTTIGQTENALNFGASTIKNHDGDIKLLQNEIQRLIESNYDVYIRSETQGQNSRLKEIFSDWPEINFGTGTLHEGFFFPDAKVAVVNDHELFSRKKRRFRYQRFRSGTKLNSHAGLQRGDYVVHIDHGIGQFIGIQHLQIEGREHDCLMVTYGGEDRLFVPIEQLDRLRKYSSSEENAPTLSKLGGTAWEKLKERTRTEIFEMASELVQLYAERKARPGFGFSTDGLQHQQLEASFPFQETVDQLQTMEEVKSDMEAPHPMDRLVCGDVGYGKTEIAVRAAFKALFDEKQVAVLVPTTILAEQHFHTFSERMEHTAARIEVLSRFRTTQQQKQVIEATKNGHVDILIGTHRILSKDISFRDLGLLVVDEEQRFGVRHKEKLKKLKRLVDVLTLTATPIPRTLHMSMMGSRDMSVINTPPQDRIPIQTEILAFDEDRIAEAIQREIERGGQVYFVHNRIRPLDNLQTKLQDLLPHTRFVSAHGQMPARQLEKIMMDFMLGKYDCLISTMIIESGIDIPSVNTIFIDRADTLGLGQLYQIRGRVGRSNERAYAYLLVPKDKPLTKKSRQRLRAIEEFTDLGSGFNIAMRDMEIRGAGNLIGAQQHGFISAIGFDLYCRLLDEAMRELKDGQNKDYPEPDINIVVSAYIPDEYIPDADHKMEFYQRMANAQLIVDLFAIREEMQDRFGRIPNPAMSLIHLMEIRIMARQLGLDSLQLDKGRLSFSFCTARKIESQDIQRFVEKSPIDLEFELTEKLCVQTSVNGSDELDCIEKTRNLLEEIL